MKKILLIILMIVFVLSIMGVAYANTDECPKPPQLFCAAGQDVGWFKDDNGCTITKCVEKTENTVYCWNSATCVNGAVQMNSNRCAVDSDCVCGGEDLNTRKCYVGNKAYYDVNVDKTKDCLDYCTGLEGRLVKCVKNSCTLMLPTDTTADANLSPPKCVTTVSGSVTTVIGSCCIEGICKTTSNSCAQGYMVNFFGCSDTCTPKFECLLNTTKNCIMEGYQTKDTNPYVGCCEGLVPKTSPELVGRATCVKSGATSEEKPVVSTITNPTITGVNNCPTPATALFTDGKVIGVFKNDNGCPIFKCVDVSENNPTITTSVFPVVCFDESLNRQVLEINKRLGEAKDDTQIAELKTKLENINAEILKKKDECAQKKQSVTTTPSISTVSGQPGIRTGQVCEVSENLRIKQDGAWKAYKEAIEKGDDAAIASAKTTIEIVRTLIESERKTCMSFIVPGQIKKEEGQEKITECKVPQELYDKLEGLWKKAHESNTGTDGVFDPILPADVQKAINEAEEKIRYYKSKCNAPTVTATTNSQYLADGYKERIAAAISSTDGTEAKIQSLKELRKEIDETIKNLIKEQKKFKFKEFKDITDDVTISPGSVEIGDSKTESKDVEIETEIEGDNITVLTSDDFVLLEDSGLSVEASSVDISSDGITVNGTNLKISPKKLLTKSKGLEQYKANAKVKVEKIKGKIQYRAEYQSQKKLFGFIPMTANNAVEVDAVSGEVTSKESPWWNGIATDASRVKTEAVVEAEIAT